MNTRCTNCKRSEPEIKLKRRKYVNVDGYVSNYIANVCSSCLYKRINPDGKGRGNYTRVKKVKETMFNVNTDVVKYDIKHKIDLYFKGK